MTIQKMIPEYNTQTFTDIWECAADFVEDYTTCELQGAITDKSAKTLYYLLYARFGNSPIANRDPNQFKYKIFSIIYQFGPTWERKLEIQKTLRELDEQALLSGSYQIYNHAYNPSSEPGTDTDNIISFINEQNVSKNKKSKTEAYMMLWNMLRTDVTSDFLRRFDGCFKKFVKNENPLLYITEYEIDDSKEVDNGY